jgi:nitrogenase molybdenum-iron protein NifN
MEKSSYISTTNACKLCKPLGACLAFRGIEGSMPLLHGSQGCATYMRRYIISHFREPMDIASSSLGEKHAVYGGGPNLKQGLKNIINKFGAKFIGIATTCLTETIGDNVPMIVNEFRRETRSEAMELPYMVTVSTPSYSGTHIEGFHAATKAIVDQIPVAGERMDLINVLPGFVSPADIRHLKEILDDFSLPAAVLPDYSETLDGPAQEDDAKIPDGGTAIEDIRNMGKARATIEFGRTLPPEGSAGGLLSERFAVPLHRLGIPIGIRETDGFFQALEQFAGASAPEKHRTERGRLVDAYVDSHKYLFGKRAIVYGEEDLVVGITSFLTEVGIKPVLCASGGKSGRFAQAIEQVVSEISPELPVTMEGVDFYEIEEAMQKLSPDLMIGTSKGYQIAKRMGIPLLRAGFPIHDRFGGQRMLHVGYRGTQNLLDRIVNTVIEKNQTDSPVGYGYM